MTASESRWPWFGRPPVREPQPSAKVPALTGKRVVLSTPEGFIYDMRAASDRYVSEDNLDVLDVVSEEDWFRWLYRGEKPRRAQWAAHLVWVE